MTLRWLNFVIALGACLLAFIAGQAWQGGDGWLMGLCLCQALVWAGQATRTA